jgi:hypothetical protein
MLDGKQYEWTISNAKKCSGKWYISPNSILKSPSILINSSTTEGRANYYLAILAIVPPSPIIRLFIETYELKIGIRNLI